MDKTTLIIGASTNPGRMANMVTQELRERDIPVHALGRRSGTIADVSIETTPQDFPEQEIDTVGMYINPSLQPQYYDYIIGLQPRRVFFNPGTENPEFCNLLKENGVECLNACMMVALTVNRY